MEQDIMSEPIIVKKQNQEVSELIDIKVIPKDLLIMGEQSIAKVIRSAHGEGFLVSSIAEMTNVSERAVWKHIYRCAISTVPMGPQSLRSLKDAGVLMVHATRAAFVPIDAVKQLLKLISTPEAWAIYYQLWNNSAKLEEVEAKLLETSGQLKSALDRSAITEAKLRLQEQKAAETQKQNEELIRFSQQVADESKSKDAELQRLRNQLQAAIDHMEHKGKGKRRVRHSVVDIEFVEMNIFSGPDYRVSIKKLEMAEMSGREKDVFGLQRGISSICGIAGSMQKRAARMDVSNPEVMGALKDLSAASDSAYHKLMPEAGRVFGLKDGESIEYMN
jgi:hypothetical protein